jgi:hypothetical protein
MLYVKQEIETHTYIMSTENKFNYVKAKTTINNCLIRWNNGHTLMASHPTVYNVFLSVIKICSMTSFRGK